jgi:hypothetical protein
MPDYTLARQQSSIHSLNALISYQKGSSLKERYSIPEHKIQQEYKHAIPKIV